MGGPRTCARMLGAPGLPRAHSLTHTRHTHTHCTHTPSHVSHSLTHTSEVHFIHNARRNGRETLTYTYTFLKQRKRHYRSENCTKH